MTYRRDNDYEIQPLSIDDFKKWMENHSGGEFSVDPRRGLIGSQVEPKVSRKKLAARMDPEDGEVNEMCRKFSKNGGVVRDVDGNYVLIEIDSGSFIVPRSCIRRKDD